MLLCLRRFWAVVLALTVLGGGLMYFRTVRSYRPMYQSEAMFSVSVHYSGTTDLSGYSYYYDKAAAKLVTETFPYLLQSESTQELIRQKLGVNYINGSISSSSVADTNLFALTVTSSNPQDAYDIVRAVMEGVGYSMKDCLEIIRRMGVPVREVRASGGGGRSILWRQMLADMFGKKVTTTNVSEGPALGAAILAGTAAGVYASVAEGCDAVLKRKTAQQPEQEARLVYKACYPLYQSLYRSLKKEFVKLDELSR